MRSIDRTDTADKAAALIASDSLARRNVVVLVLAQVVLGSQLPVTFILGGLAGQSLSPVKCLATLPISVIIFGSMLMAPLLSHLMQQRGRAAGFCVGAAGGAIGSALCAWALLISSFPLFLFGSILTGAYMSAQGFYRFAATDGASEAFRPTAISWVMAAGLASAIVGPQLVKLTENALAPVPFAGAYLAAAALNIVGIPIFGFLDAPKPAARSPGSTPIRGRWDLIRTPRIAVAMICGMVSYALMNLVMTSTPLAIVGCGFGTADAANVVSAHVLAMFAPSFVTGYLIARFGVERILAAGLAILSGAGLVGLSGVDLGHFFVTLILLGIGWNFGFIGATAMLTSAHRPEERGRVQGMNDFAVFGLVGLASLASGGLMNCSGGSAIEGWQAVNLAMIPMIALAGAALIWLAILRDHA
jgi:MFS family permease